MNKKQISIEELKELLKESIDKLDRYAKRQKSTRAITCNQRYIGSRRNVHAGCHYEAVQSYIDRAKNALKP